MDEHGRPPARSDPIHVGLMKSAADASKKKRKNAYFNFRKNISYLYRSIDRSFFSRFFLQHFLFGSIQCIVYLFLFLSRFQCIHSGSGLRSVNTLAFICCCFLDAGGWEGGNGGLTIGGKKLFELG